MKWRTLLGARKIKSPVGLEYSADIIEPVTETLEDMLAWLKKQLASCSDVVFKDFMSDNGVPGALIYIQGMIDLQLLETMIENGLTQTTESTPSALSPTYTENLNQALQMLLDGQLLLLTDGVKSILILPLRKIEKRAITEPTNENVIRGPREAFVEDLETNVTMVRRRIKHPALKTERMKFGTYTQTSVMLMYLDGICKPKLIQEVKHRLERIHIDGVLEASVLEEFISDNPYSPFPQLQYTERVDSLTAALLEGRVAMICDGSPTPIIAPVTFYMLLQSAEDYYQNFILATWIRWIRYIFLLVSLLLPSVYISIITYHPEMLPPNLLVTVAAAREAVPFPALVEALFMELTFEALREGGLRIPKTIGQTLSIIGALIVGQAAVEAGIVSAPMVIVVSMTGIASFVIPHYNLGLTLRLIRFPIMLFAGTFGMIGIIVSVLILYLHLINLRSFGTPYLSPLAPIKWNDWKDVFVRAPWWKMHTRPTTFGTQGGVREQAIHLPQIPKDENGD